MLSENLQACSPVITFAKNLNCGLVNFVMLSETWCLDLIHYKKKTEIDLSNGSRTAQDISKTPLSYFVVFG
jgi:hypothetical protein